MLQTLAVTYMVHGVTLGNVSCNLSCNVNRKGLDHIVKFRANPNVEFPMKEIAGQVPDVGITVMCNAE